MYAYNVGMSGRLLRCEVMLFLICQSTGATSRARRWLTIWNVGFTKEDIAKGVNWMSDD